MNRVVRLLYALEAGCGDKPGIKVYSNVVSASCKGIRCFSYIRKLLALISPHQQNVIHSNRQPGGRVGLIVSGDPGFSGGSSSCLLGGKQTARLGLGGLGTWNHLSWKTPFRTSSFRMQLLHSQRLWHTDVLAAP